MLQLVFRLHVVQSLLFFCHFVSIKPTPLIGIETRQNQIRIRVHRRQEYTFKNVPLYLSSGNSLYSRPTIKITGTVLEVLSVEVYLYI